MMISRYSLYDIASLSKRFQLIQGLPKGIKAHYNISPATAAPIVLQQGNERTIKPAKWGLVARGAKDINSVFRYKTYNIPSEKILSKHSWDRAVREARCLLPANGFYYNDPVNSNAYYTYAKNNELVAFAGVHGTWQDPDGTTHSTFSMITIQSPQDGTRVPVILTEENEARWLDSTLTDTGSIYDMLRTHDVDALHTHRVASATVSPKINRPDLISPLS